LGKRKQRVLIYLFGIAVAAAAVFEGVSGFFYFNTFI